MSTNTTEDREEKEALRTAIAGLPDDLREPVILYYFHRLTQAEIGKCLSCSQKTVHQRLGKGLERLNRQLAGNAALGAMLLASSVGQALLDVVSPSLIASVKHSIGSYYAASAASAAGASGQVIGAEAITTTGITTGGLVMQAKLLTAAAIIAVSGMVAGAVFSDQVFASARDEAHAIEVAGLQRQVEDGQRDLRSQNDDVPGPRSRSAAKLSELTQQLELLLAQLADKDQENAVLNARIQELLGAGGDAEPAKERSREEQWKSLQETLSDVWDLLVAIDQPGANRFELGPRMVAEISKLSSAQFDEIMAFDADETDLEIIHKIRVIMRQAFIFVPGVSEQRNDYMDRYLERAESGAYGERFTNEALRRSVFSMPPFFDGYKKIVAPLNDEVRAKFLEIALDRASRGKSEALRVDGTEFLTHVDDPLATAELMRVFGNAANSQQLRLSALKGISTRADEDVLRLLRDTAGTEQDATILAAVEKAAACVEKLLADQR